MDINESLKISLKLNCGVVVFVFKGEITTVCLKRDGTVPKVRELLMRLQGPRVQNLFQEPRRHDIKVASCIFMRETLFIRWEREMGLT